MSESMREEFEKEYGVESDYPEGEERSIHILERFAWNAAWQASRAALCVELPKIVNSEWACTSDECAAMRDAIRFCKQAIHAAGVKTK